MAKDKRISEREFGLNLNLDDSLKALTPGEGRYILNCVSGINKEGNVGAVENERGNELVSFELPSGINTVIGTARDDQRNAIIFFVQNNLARHSIIRYNAGPRTIQYILKEQSILNFYRFQRRGYITHANVVDDLLYWVDGVNEARKINMIKAINFTAGDFENGYAFVDNETITAIKAPPLIAPQTKDFTDITRTTNFIAQKGFQFAYRYVYDDNEKSVFSPWSRNHFPPFDPMLADDVHDINRRRQFNNAESKGNNFPFSSFKVAYNAIYVTIRIGTKNVNFIEIIARDSEVDDWNIIETLDNQLLVKLNNPGSEYRIAFYNDTVGITVSDSQALKSQDFFPIAPKTQEFTHLNNLVYGNYKDGFDLEDVSLKAVVTSNTFLPMPWTFPRAGNVNPNNKGQIPFTDKGDYKTAPFPNVLTLNEGDFLMLGSFDFVNADNFYPAGWYRMTDWDIVSQTDFNESFTEAVRLQGYNAFIETTSGLLRVNDAGSTNHPLLAIEFLSEPDMSKPTFKSGAWHQFAIQYFDDWGRRGSAQTSDDAKIYIPNWGEKGTSLHGYINTVSIEISNTPPDWAVSYQILYSGALNITDFIQFPFLEAIADSSQVVEDIIAEGDLLAGRINLKGWTDFLVRNDRISREFTFEVGDFIREIKTYVLQSRVQHLSSANKSERVNKIDLNNLQETVSSLGQIKDNLDATTAPVLQDPLTGPEENTTDYDVTDTPTVVVLRILGAQFESASVEFELNLTEKLKTAPFARFTIEVLKNGDVMDGATFTETIFPNFGKRYTNSFALTPDYLPLDVGDIIGIRVEGKKVTPSDTVETHVDGSTYPSRVLIKSEAIPATSIIEQYKSKPAQELLIYREIGKTYKIVNPGKTNRYHEGDFNQTGGDPARVIIDRGDAWIRTRPFEDFQVASVPPTYENNMGHTIEDPDNSDYYPSSSKGYGRPVGENPDFRRTDEINGLRHTGTFIEGTKTNQLNEVDFDFVEYVNARHGAITALREVGFTLKVLQESRLTSIYIGRQTTTNPEGTQDLILSDRVFASINPSEIDYGSLHPESVLKHDRNLYFFDVRYGKIIRDSSNGMVAVSDYKVSKLFRDLSDLVRSKDTTFCRGSWNDEPDSYVFTFFDGSPNPDGEDDTPPPLGPPVGPPIDTLPPGEAGESEIGHGVLGAGEDSFTISFQETTNKWKSFHSYIGEEMEFLGKEFVSFENGRVWRHNADNAKRMNFYDSQYEMVLQPVSNMAPDAVKTFDAIAIQANKRPKIVELSVPPNALYGNGMASRLQGSNFALIEGNFYAGLKKDLNTPIGGSDIFRLNNGREIRGNVCEFKITYDSTDKVIITRLIVELEKSLISD